MLFSRTFSVHKNGFAKCPLSPQPPFIMFWKWFYYIYISYQKCPFFCGIHVNYISKFILIGIPKYVGYHCHQIWIDYEFFDNPTSILKLMKYWANWVYFSKQYTVHVFQWFLKNYSFWPKIIHCIFSLTGSNSVCRKG